MGSCNWACWSGVPVTLETRKHQPADAHAAFSLPHPLGQRSALGIKSASDGRGRGERRAGERGGPGTQGTEGRRGSGARQRRSPGDVAPPEEGVQACGVRSRRNHRRRAPSAPPAPRAGRRRPEFARRWVTAKRSAGRRERPPPRPRGSSGARTRPWLPPPARRHPASTAPARPVAHRAVTSSAAW